MNLLTVQNITNTATGLNEQYFRPKDYFVWYEGFLPVIRTTTNVTPLNGYYYRTVAYYLNAFGNVDINGWDGLSISVNEQEGYIFAPTVGAGYKEPFTNMFTGVIMGIDKTQLKSSFSGLFSADDIDKQPYMVGLYGYQDGISSFGIMENGTAYFGRADRGGRIWIDGYNAWIYGGTMIPPASSDPTDVNMENRMRLVLLDLAHVDGSPDINVDGQVTLKVGEFRDIPRWYIKWIMRPYYDMPSPALSPIGVTNQLSDVVYDTGSGPIVSTESAVGSTLRRGSITPAIEIGQHPEKTENWSWLRDYMLIPWSTANVQAIFGSLHIPGFRNFLVTYDGTMWARNAVVQGNLIGSNIIAGRFMTENYYIDEEGNVTMGPSTKAFPYQSGGYNYTRRGNFSELLPSYW